MRKWKQSEMVEMLDGYGYDLLSEYKNAGTLMDLWCRKGDHSIRRNFNNIKSGFDCPKCAGNYNRNINEVRKLFADGDVILLEKRFINAHKTMNCYCMICKNDFTITLANWLKGRGCPHCWMKRQGAGVTDEVLIRNWIESVFDKDKMSYNNIRQIVNPETGKWLELDIWIACMGKAIEINGKYHNNAKTKIRDKLKRELCEYKNIDLLDVWVYDWKNNRVETENKIKTFLRIKDD